MSIKLFIPFFIGLLVLSFTCNRRQQKFFGFVAKSNDSNKFIQNFELKTIWPIEKKLSKHILEFSPEKDSTIYELKTSGRTDTFSLSYKRHINELNSSREMEFTNFKYFSRNALPHQFNVKDSFGEIFLVVNIP